MKSGEQLVRRGLGKQLSASQKTDLKRIATLLRSTIKILEPIVSRECTNFVGKLCLFDIMRCDNYRGSSVSCQVHKEIPYAEKIMKDYHLGYLFYLFDKKFSL